MLHAVCFLLTLSAPNQAPSNQATPAPDTVVVCPREFLPALSPWLAYREKQGHQIEILSNTRNPADIKSELKRLGAGGQLEYLLLVGDSDPALQQNPVIRQVSVPTHHAQAKVNVKWGSEPEIGTDNWYADLDDDLVPELAIGRLPVDSREELAVVVKKILDYEQNSDFGAWRRRVNFVAGVGGFGAVADSVLESATRKFLTDGIPPAFQTSMTYGSWRSAYCPDPRQFHEMALQRFNEGCLFWVYIGHGQRTYLDRVHVPGNAYHILDVDDVPKLDHGGRAPIAVFLSCYAGAFDGPHDCLAEQMVLAPRGPVAALCGSRVTMPYAMSVMASELLREVFAGPTPTLGQVLRHAKQKLAQPPAAETAGSETRQLLDSLAKLISPAPEMLDEERREHLLLFNLLGDPLLRLPRPLPAKVEVVAGERAGESVVVNVDSAVAGSCTLDLVCRRDRLRGEPPVREYYDGRDRILRQYHETYERANDTTWCVQQVTCRAGKNQFEFAIPVEARGQCHVRAFIAGQESAALGSVDLFVRKPKEAGAAVGSVPGVTR